MEEIYLLSHFEFNGIKSYHLPLCGFSLAERVHRKYPYATVYFEQKRGRNGEDLLGLSLKNLSDYPFVRRRLNEAHLLNLLRKGVLIEDLESVYVEEGTEIEKGVVIRQGSYIESGCFIGAGSKIGPYAYLRRGSYVGKNCRVGDFTEMKNASLGDGSKMSHLTYLGDSDVGKNCNIGCGVVFVNYDGKQKRRSYIGDNCFIGSNCNLVAPVTVGDGAYLACGSTLTKDLEEGDFCIARSRETVKHGRGKEYYPEKQP
ncbi:MAG: hypothetical protein IJY26_00445 [Clostridia bacterium]|nr:hypothetical protein [Clostridia bacterium]